MRNAKRIIPVLLALVLLFTSTAFAALPSADNIMGVGRPTLTVNGNTATCAARVTFAGKTIDATLELWQGSSLVASWNKTGASTVSFSETETIIHGLTYTLTISGTANGIAFTPQSVTKTL